MPRRSTFRITQRSVNALSATEREVFAWDRDLPGFGVRVHVNGRKTYVVQSRGPTGLRRATVGVHGDLDAGGARKRAAGMIDRIKRGEDPEPRPVAPEPTVGELADRYWRMHVEVNCGPNTAALYRGALHNHIVPSLGEKPIGQVRRDDVAGLHHRLRETPRMADTAILVLGKMFSLAEQWGLMPVGRNPCRSVRRYGAKRRERFLTPDEYRRVGQALRESEATGFVWPPAVTAIRLLMLTGCRRNEILTLRWSDVDRTTRELRIREGKTGPRLVPLTPAVKTVLTGVRRRPRNPWVIVGREPGKRLKHLRYYWCRVRKTAGLDDVRIHDLRHSYATRALSLGEGLSVIGRLLGHTQTASTARYTHVMGDAERAAAAKVGDSIASHIAPECPERAFNGEE